ncbi:unnamed protein product [Closterium sp. NIES-54]
MATTTTPGGQRVSICTCTRTGRHLATFTRRPGSSLYTLTSEPPQVAASAQVSASGPVADSPVAPTPWSPLLATPSWHALPPPCLWSSQVSASPLALACPALPSLRRGAAAHRSSLLLVSPDGCSPADSPHIRVGHSPRQWIGPRALLPAVRFQLREQFCQDLPVQSFTLPASPQQNRIPERRIGLVMEVARTSMIHAAAPHFLWPFAVWYVAHQLSLWPRVSLPETSPTLRWTGKVGEASVFRVWGSRAFVRDTSADKLSSRAIPCISLAFPLKRLAASPPPVDPLPPQGPAPSGVSQVDPLPVAVPIEVVVDSGAARGAASGGVASGGTASGGAEPVSAEPGGAESEGAESGGAEPEGAEPGGIEPEGAESNGAESGGAKPRGTKSAGGPAGASPRVSHRREPLSSQQLREWFAQHTRVRSGAAGAGGSAIGGTGAGGDGAAGPGGARTSGTGAARAGGVGGARAGDPGTGGTGAGDHGAGGTGAGGAGAGGTGAGGAGASCPGGAGVTVGAGGTGGAGAAGPGGARTRGTGAAGAGGVGGAGAGEHGAGGTGSRDSVAGGAGARDPGAGGTGVGGAGAGGAGAGYTRARGAGAGGAGAGGPGAEDPGAGRDAGAAGPGGARTRGTGAAGAGGVGGAGAGEHGAGGTGSRDSVAGGAGARDPGAGGTGVGGAGAGGAGAGYTRARGAGAGGAGAGGPGAEDPGAGGAGSGGAAFGHTSAGGTVQRRPFFVSPPPSSLTPPDSVLCQPDSPLPAPSPYAEQTDSLTERREPESRPASLVCAVCTGHRVPRPRPPPVPGTHIMELLPSSVPLRVPLPSPPTSSLPDIPDPESNLARAACPIVPRLLATVVTDPSFESTAVSALVAELVDFAAACRLDYATSLVAESESDCPPSVGGECAIGTDVLEDRQGDFECLAAAVPHLVAMLLAPEEDPDAPDIPTSRSYAKAITSPYSSQWQTAMDAEMASWKSTGTYVDAVPSSRANIIDGMWIFRGVDFFQTFSPIPKMTTLRVLLHVAAQRDYELHSLDFSTTFLQGSLHEEIWLRRPPGFTGLFLAGTKWSLRWPVYGLRQVPREWHDTLRTMLAALGFAPSTADPSLFLRTDTSLPPFYVLVYVDNLVFATADTEALALMESEL